MKMIKASYLILPVIFSACLKNSNITLKQKSIKTANAIQSLKVVQDDINTINPSGTFNENIEVPTYMITQEKSAYSMWLGGGNRYLNVKAAQSFTTKDAGFLDYIEVTISALNTPNSPIIYCDLTDENWNVLEKTQIDGFSDGSSNVVRFNFSKSIKLEEQKIYHFTVYVEDTEDHYAIHGFEGLYEKGAMYDSRKSDGGIFHIKPWDMMFRINIIKSQFTSSNNLCAKNISTKVDVKAPISEVNDWGPPKKLGSGVNTPCIEDAIEISRDGNTLYYLFIEDIPERLTYEKLTNLPNGTYRATKLPSSGPEEFNNPTFFNLGSDVPHSLDGELSFHGSTFYFHSNRPTNTGLNPVQQCCLGPNNSECVYDLLDIYTGVLDESGVAKNITKQGLPNSICWEGEHAIHPIGSMLFFASNRKRHISDTRIDKDIWVSIKRNGSWIEASQGGLENINSFGNDIQPTFTSDGRTMYFTSDRDGEVKIYRSIYTDRWGPPEVVISGVVGEPSITADGQYLYFVHVLTDSNGSVFDSDIWYSQKQ